MSVIAIDARQINTSTGHYIARLVEHLETIDTKNEYLVLVLKKDLAFYTPKAPNFKVVVADFPIYSFAEQIGFGRLLTKLKPDLVHFCMPQQPLLYFGKRVTTVHDTTLIRYENVDMNPFVYKIRKLIFTVLLRNVIARSKTVLTPTDYVKNDLDEWTNRKYTPKLLRTHESGDMIHSEPETIAILKDTRFLFWVGNAFPYKNITRTVDAFAKLKESYPDLHLALAGRKDSFYEEIEKDVITRDIKDVHFLGYVSDGEKRWAFQNAAAYVCASLSEGFHIPLLEAQYESCPVITSNATCLPEVAAEAALYFNPHSTDELVTAVEKLLLNPSLREELIAKGHENTKRFSWQKMAEETLRVYEDALGKS